MVAVVGSVLKAHRILSSFNTGGQILSVRQLSAKTGIPRSTAHELCATLVEAGYLELIAGHGYRLGVNLVAMAGPVLERIGLAEASAASMDRLARLHTGEVFLSLLTYPWNTYIAYVRTQEKLPVRRNIGLRLPLHASGSGIVILSRFNDSKIAEYMEDLSAAQRLKLTGQLERARRDGYLFSESFQRDINSMSAPIQGPYGTVIGALALCQPASILDEGKAAEMGAIIREEAATINRVLA